jgi:hypothetical protein
VTGEGETGDSLSEGARESYNDEGDNELTKDEVGEGMLDGERPPSVDAVVPFSRRMAGYGREKPWPVRWFVVVR